MAFQNTINNLKYLLADTYALYLKTQNYHWNIGGEHFYSLHKLLETHYQELAEAIDKIAERIRALGENAPGSFDEFQKLSKLSKPDSKFVWDRMIQDLHDDHQILASELQKMIGIAEDEKEYVSVDMMTERLEHHQQASWMLSMLLKEKR